MVRSSLLVALAAAISTSLASARADTLIVEGIDQARSSSIQRPARGMTMDKVETTWGRPVSKQNAVGDPPISRWEYADFVVYFEYRNVIHAVRKR